MHLAWAAENDTSVLEGPVILEGQDLVPKTQTRL